MHWLRQTQSWLRALVQKRKLDTDTSVLLEQTFQLLSMLANSPVGRNWPSTTVRRNLGKSPRGLQSLPRRT